MSLESDMQKYHPLAMQKEAEELAVTTPSAKAKGFYPCVYHAERDCSPSLNNILASLLNRSFANRIEKGQFIPELKQGDFLRPSLKIYKKVSCCKVGVINI